MASSHHPRPRFLLLLGAALFGCSRSPDPAAGAATAGGDQLGEFIAHVSPKNRSITFTPVKKNQAPGLGPQDLNGDGDSLNIDNDGIAGSGSTTTVELVTNSVDYDADCPVGYQSETFCASVTLRHFYSQPLSDVFVQATEIVDATDTALTGHSGLNSDPEQYGLSNTLGLWEYTGSGVTTTGVMGANSPYNAGTTNWVFQDPDGADTYIRLRVLAGMSYSGYSFDYSTATFVDACSLGSSTTDPSTTETLPFTFTFWDQVGASVELNKRGMLTFGGVAGTADGNNVCLPDTSAPHAGLFVFWDDLDYGSGGQMCWTTVGSEPNRQFVVEWSNMDFASDDPGSSDVGSSLTFEAILSEGTNNVDLVYDTMTPPGGSSSTRASGTSATVGVQNSDGTVAPEAECGMGDFGSGQAYTLGPIP